MTGFLQNLLQLSLEAAPWLLLGIIVGGLLKVWIPTGLLQRHLGGTGMLPVIKAAIFGAPLPLCSCGVIPAALALRQAGASKKATASFLVSTPETGVDSISVSYALLGPFMAIVRPIAAILSAIVAGLLAGSEDTPFSKKVATETATSGCYSGLESTATSCCDSESCSGEKDLDEWPNNNVVTRIRAGLHYGFTSLLDDILLWLLVGLVFAAVIKTFVPATFLAAWGSGLVAMLVMLVIGIPMYVCATASTPIAAGLMLAGVSPGTALVFLLAGPATNIATLGVVGKELGKRSLVGYLFGVMSTALMAGFLTDFLVQRWDIDIQAQLAAGNDIVPLWLAWLSLGLLLFASVRRPLETLGMRTISTTK